jgi:NADPH-ferrihemoprotein reductase
MAASEWYRLGLTGLHCAFSREGREKVYVQHHLHAHRQAVYRMLEQEHGCLYICGDAKRMARDVQRCLIDMRVELGGQTEEEAHGWMKRLREQGRLMEDVWS